jgi:hypothetical protein
MHTGEHHLSVSGTDELSQLLLNEVRGKASDGSPRIRNNAVSTVLVTPILYFKKCPGALWVVRKRKLLKFQIAL